VQIDGGRKVRMGGWGRRWRVWWEGNDDEDVGILGGGGKAPWTSFLELGGLLY